MVYMHYYSTHLEREAGRVERVECVRDRERERD